MPATLSDSSVCDLRTYRSCSGRSRSDRWRISSAIPVVISKPRRPSRSKASASTGLMTGGTRRTSRKWILIIGPMTLCPHRAIEAQQQVRLLPGGRKLVPGRRHQSPDSLRRVQPANLFQSAADAAPLDQAANIRGGGVARIEEAKRGRHCQPEVPRRESGLGGHAGGAVEPL